jgi:hypothetical protein
MVRTIACLVAVALALSVITAIAQDSDKEQTAVLAAEKWLRMVDEGKYSDSWQEAAEYFRNAINQEQWNRLLQGVRKPLGEVVSRQMKSATYTTSLPGAPDGEYVVIQFDTAFENKKAAIETVTPMMDQDGTWRVSGYYIK